MVNYHPNYQTIDEISVLSPVVVRAVPLHEWTYLNAGTSQAIRQTFITRVYSIVWFQLLVTTIFIVCCNQLHALQTFMVSPIGTCLMISSIIVVFALTCCLYGNQDKLRTCPGSGIYLTLFTGSVVYMVGSVGIYYKLSTLLLSGLSTLGIFSGLSLYAIQTKYDYTDKGGYLIASLLGLLIFGFIASFTTIPILGIVYSSVGSVIFSCYIVYDTQCIVGGDHRRIMYHTDDYVLAATSLYLDIINLFLMILDVISGRN